MGEMRIPDFSRARVLVFGDVMLDEYVMGSVGRISPEAPIPVFLRAEHRYMPGGASNVAANAAALGARVTLCGVIGDDAHAEHLRQALAASSPAVTLLAVVDPSRGTTVKTRFIAGGHHVLRVDTETVVPVPAEIGRALVEQLKDAITRTDVVVVSDYAKGVVVEATFRALIAAASLAGKPVFVDPKRRDFGFYRGADYLTPNRKELHEATGLPVDDDAAVERASQAASSASSAAILVTRSEEGMTLFRSGSPALHLRASPREVFDVSGAGDTVIATFASAMAAGHAPPEAAMLANIAAGISVGKQGASCVSTDELRDALRARDIAGEGRHRLMSLEAAVEQRRRWRESGWSVGFTNGCFDILHGGHVQLLDQVARNCDRLIVGLNADASVRLLKGPGRPINTAEARARVLLGLRAVDAVVIFEEETPAQLIRALTPDLLAKGGDYRRHEIVGADFVEERGGKVLIVKIVEGFSTTAIIDSARAGDPPSRRAAE
ncbi:D-beta-D-heptose 7-phosphate kinase / D-beta-D-heptose 1-phosphate adenosyltransferase [Rhizobiales bacterium GAS188]|nr:D-beta-D-heptose 7-phosphate kinase / D-beta-D-heptose 1-phosphate adenosyltransferase [Rhizobiales bacterium GAS188]